MRRYKERGGCGCHCSATCMYIRESIYAQYICNASFQSPAGLGRTRLQKEKAKASLEMECSNSKVSKKKKRWLRTNQGIRRYQSVHHDCLQAIRDTDLPQYTLKLRSTWVMGKRFFFSLLTISRRVKYTSFSIETELSLKENGERLSWTRWSVL